MAFHKNYHAGETYRHTAARENDISLVLNQLCGFRLNGLAGSSAGVVRVSCYNASGSRIDAGMAVEFPDDGSFCGDAVPVKTFSDDQKPWAVLENTLENNKIGTAIVAGVAVVSISGASKKYVVPDPSSPGAFQYADSGTARVIFSKDGKAVVLLSSAVDTGYDGPFSVRVDENGQIAVTAGYLNRNGDFVDVAAATIAPSAGMICVCSTLDGGGNWSSPEIRIETPAMDAYPIGSCKVENGVPTVCCFRQPVAIIMITGECPLSANAQG